MGTLPSVRWVQCRSADLPSSPCKEQGELCVSPRLLMVITYKHTSKTAYGEGDDFLFPFWPSKPHPSMQGTRRRSESRVTFANSGWAEAQPNTNTGAGGSSLPALYYLSSRVERIPLDRQSSWAHNTALLWPDVARVPPPTPDFCQAAKKILADNLQQFEQRAGGEEWSYAKQDSFEGREDIARTEGHLADE
eukprot:2429195-Amphidinium_carterae.1